MSDLVNPKKRITCSVVDQEVKCDFMVYGNPIHKALLMHCNFDPCDSKNSVSCAGKRYADLSKNQAYRQYYF
jgi:hypothetical protein